MSHYKIHEISLIKVTQRHSVEVLSTAYLNYFDGSKYLVNANRNINIQQLQKPIPELQETKVILLLLLADFAASLQRLTPLSGV